MHMWKSNGMMFQPNITSPHITQYEPVLPETAGESIIVGKKLNVNLFKLYLKL
jgi:hypothetical protein